MIIHAAKKKKFILKNINLKKKNKIKSGLITIDFHRYVICLTGY